MYSCECGFSCKSKFSLQRHQKSKSHELNLLCGESISMNENGLYVCNVCNFETTHKGHYREHVMSNKHGVAKKGLVHETITLTEVMDMFLKQTEMFMKHQQVQNTELIKAMVSNTVVSNQQNLNARFIKQ